MLDSQFHRNLAVALDLKTLAPLGFLLLCSPKAA